jgi:drug/metabolite transporter (DMT)-like permease
MTKTPDPRRLAGWGWVLTAIAIWASWFAVTAAGVRGTLAAVDVALIRVVVPTLILLLPLWHARQRLAALGLRDILGLALYGVPFVMLVAAGLRYAPVSHAVALVPGFMPVLAGLWAAAQGVRHPARRLAGFALMTTAAVLVVGTGGSGQVVGHLCFLGASFCFALFTVTARRLELPPLVSTGIVAGVSAAVLGPIYLVWPLGTLALASWSELARQALVQGVLTGFLATFAYARALRLLGTPSASAAVALVPPGAALIGWLALGERPSGLEAAAVAIVAAGVVAASDLPLRRRGMAGTA